MPGTAGHLNWSCPSIPHQNKRRDSNTSSPVYIQSYTILWLPAVRSKTRETAFQVLNRTVWTNNKAFKSRMRANPHCDWCCEMESMEHLLCVCEYYSHLQWGRLGDVLSQHFNNRSADNVPRVELQPNIIYNIPHPSLLLHIPGYHLQTNELASLRQPGNRPWTLSSTHWLSSSPAPNEEWGGILITIYLLGPLHLSGTQLRPFCLFITLKY